MERKNDVFMKWVQTALLAALCFVSFTFYKSRYLCPEVTPRPCTSGMPSVYWPHCCWAADMEDWRGLWV